MNGETIPRRIEDTLLAIGLGVAAGIAAGVAAFWGLVQFLTPMKPGAVLATWFPVFVRWSGGVYDWLPWWCYGLAGAALLFGGGIGWMITWPLVRPRSAIQRVSGRESLTGRQAVRQAIRELAVEHKWGGRGLPIITTHHGDEIRISEDRETRHVLTIGSVGGGKTTVIRQMIDAAIQRGDRVIYLDNKSDLTESLEAGFSLIAPWDARGLAWDVAKDFNNRADAQELAAALISESRDPMWSNAARGILSAMIVRAQTESPGSWGFGFLAEILRGGINEIQATVKTYSPEFYPLVADAMSRTTQSIFITLLSYLRPVLDLADAWSRCETPGRIRETLNKS